MAGLRCAVHWGPAWHCATCRVCAGCKLLHLRECSCGKRSSDACMVMMMHDVVKALAHSGCVLLCAPQEAVPLVIKVLSKSMDSSLSGEKVELATLTRDDSGKVQFKIFEAAEIQPLLDAAKAEKEKEDAASS